jgi:hypothetical protein
VSRRVVVAGGVVALLAIAVLVAVAGSMTHWFGRVRPANEGQAQRLCEDSVRHDLLSPAKASFQDLAAKREQLFEDDHVSLGFNAKHVTEKWVVDGNVDSPGVSGAPARSRFTCYAYIFDNQGPRAYAHDDGSDEAGQWVIRP